ncbi:MFS transporter [Desulforhopalus singaporensis]|uniref:Predicted arabinose efflux permease, MFS family n=1 Tax=Desulforhopalus singaporensis TaxID=91360 RepID=A0A1H0TGM4_9BACT|nr:MFS transporter [Desulforhopalus singaporensis]SDP52995.1 Predicted arabinose efflux permease, MFS family [Desulforhopalus singaporensis]
MKKYTVITLLLSIFIALLGIGIIVPVMPVYAKDLGAGGFALGMIIAAFSITRGALQPVVGSLSDQWGRKRFLMVGLLIYGLVGLMIPSANTVFHLIAIRGFHGVGSAMIVPIAMAYMSLLAPAGHEGRYMSYLNIAIFCGIGCGPVIGGCIYDFFGLRVVFYAMALLSFMALLLVVRFMPGNDGTKSVTKKKLLAGFSAMLSSRKTCGILVARYATMIVMVPTMAFLPLLMSAWQETTGLQIGIVIACRTLVNAVFQIPFGRIGDTVSKLPLLLGSSLALSGLIFVIPSIDSFAMMAITYLFLGVTEACVWALLGAYASLEAKNLYGHGTMMGVFSFAMSAGVFTGAILAGTSMNMWGIVSAYHVTAVAVGGGSLLAGMLIVSGDKQAGSPGRG